MSARHHHRQQRRRRAPPGAAPGTLHLNPAESSPTVRVLRYGPSGVSFEGEVSAAELSRERQADEVLWVSLVGLGDAEILHAVADAFDIHGLTLEDIVNTHQRPKAEKFPGYDYIVLRTPAENASPSLVQLSIVLGDGFLISFEERAGVGLEPVRGRIRGQSGFICSRGAAYLAYAILDLAIDRFFPVLEQYADRIEAVEGDVLRDTGRQILPQLYSIKEELRECRRAIWPVRDLISALMREEDGHFSQDARLHLRDCFDHVVQLMDLIESDRDTATGLMELYVSNVGNRMNEVMKVLTIIATIFIPLSFITSLYGMNFDGNASPWNMPELKWRWGYPLVLSLMLLVALSMLLYFRRKGWLSGNPALRVSRTADSHTRGDGV